MLKKLLPPLLGAALTGLVVSIAVHLGACLGIRVLPQPLLLGPGIFVVWLPVVFVATRLAKDFKQKDFWRAVLRGCPGWMRKGLAVLFAYALVNFVVLFLDTSHPAQHSSGGHSLAEVRGFTGHFMVFYAAACAIFYSAIQVMKSDSTPRCPAGHPVSPSASFCEQCGAKVGF